jgi:hypothetical protein
VPQSGWAADRGWAMGFRCWSWRRRREGSGLGGAEGGAAEGISWVAGALVFPHCPKTRDLQDKSENGAGVSEAASAWIGRTGQGGRWKVEGGGLPWPCLAVARRPKSHNQAPITCDLRTSWTAAVAMAVAPVACDLGLGRGRGRRRWVAGRGRAAGRAWTTWLSGPASEGRRQLLVNDSSVHWQCVVEKQGWYILQLRVKLQKRAIFV